MLQRNSKGLTKSVKSRLPVMQNRRLRIVSGAYKGYAYEDSRGRNVCPPCIAKPEAVGSQGMQKDYRGVKTHYWPLSAPPCKHSGATKLRVGAQSLIHDSLLSSPSLSPPTEEPTPTPTPKKKKIQPSAIAELNPNPHTWKRIRDCSINQSQDNFLPRDDSSKKNSLAHP